MGALRLLRMMACNIDTHDLLYNFQPGVFYRVHRKAANGGVGTGGVDAFAIVISGSLYYGLISMGLGSSGVQPVS